MNDIRFFPLSFSRERASEKSAAAVSIPVCAIRTNLGNAGSDNDTIDDNANKNNVLKHGMEEFSTGMKPSMGINLSNVVGKAE